MVQTRLERSNSHTEETAPYKCQQPKIVAQSHSYVEDPQKAYDRENPSALWEKEGSFILLQNIQIRDIRRIFVNECFVSGWNFQ